MEKFEKYNPDEETIEAWLKSFEIRLLCTNITAADRKRNWCRALVGEAGNNIIEKLTPSSYLVRDQGRAMLSFRRWGAQEEGFRNP